MAIAGREAVLRLESGGFTAGHVNFQPARFFFEQQCAYPMEAGKVCGLARPGAETSNPPLDIERLFNTPTRSEF